MNNSPQCALCIGYKETLEKEMVNMKFLGFQSYDHHTQKNHFDQMILKLNGAHCVVMSVFHSSNLKTLKLFCILLLLCNEVWNIFWGSIFQQWKDIYFIQENCQNYNRSACRSLFKNIRSFVYSIPIYVFINELHCKYLRRFSNKYVYTQY
jgi:Ca2+/Na+ antiporter